MSVPNTFAAATSAIPLANLDANFAYYDAAYSITGTAISFTGAVTLSTGTANGVPYLNASKVLTSGAVLTFDGTILSSTRFAGALNGTVGATTANTGAFTTLTTSSTVTLNGGTANGVTYLNGSKVLTSGTALTFDGNKLEIATTEQSIKITGSGASNFITIANTSRSFNFGVDATGFNIYDNTAATYRLNLSPAGNLGIGTSSPGATLEVAGNIRQNVSSASIYQALLINNSDGSGAGNRIDFSQGTSNVIGSIKSYYSGSWKLALGATSAGDSVILDASGNLGLGVTPSAWNSGWRAIEILNFGASIVSSGSGATTTNFAHGTYFNGTNWIQKVTDVTGARYQQTGSSAGSSHAWFVAANSTAGNAISFTQAMTLDASGNLGIGATLPGERLDVVGTARVVRSTGATNTGDQNAVVIGATTTGAYAASYGAGLQFQVTNSGGGYSGGRIVSRLGADNFTANLVFQARNYGYADSMTLDASGNLLVGTTTLPSNRKFIFEASGDTTGRINSGGASSGLCLEFANNGTLRGGVGNGSGNITSGAATDMAVQAVNNLVFASGGYAERMRLDSSGNLLVGTTSVNPAAGVAVNNPSTAPNIRMSHETGTASGAAYMEFNYNQSGCGSITQLGTSSVLYNTSSDYRLKNITGPITTSGAYIDSLKPVEGTWKADGSTFVGLIAHETQEASRTTVATGTKDGEQMQGMDYSSAEIIANLIAEIQDLRKRLAAAGI